MLAQTRKPPPPPPSPPNPLPHIAISAPWDSFLQRVVLSVPCCYSNPKKICVSNSLKWRHLHAILKILVRVLVYCFDQLSLSLGRVSREVQREKTPLGKQVLPIRAACLWISVSNGINAWGKAMNAQKLTPSPTLPAQATRKSVQIKRLRL